ncbi:histidinol-phosphate aminotransferase [Marinosulfonomonas sp. PRT-SC04]|nr:histidinol-phosphate aminotransferase [Marinosulfonomonas sp. PRT-SC04]
MTGPRYTPMIASLPSTVPFVGPEVQERARGHAFDARLGANENVFGTSPNAIKAMQNAVPETWMYGDSASHDLRSALATHHGVNMDNIVIGAGIDGLLGSLVRMTVTAGDKVVTSAGAYPTFNYHVNGFGGELVQVPFKDDREDPNALIKMAREVNAKLIYIANPDNPMGTWHNADVIADMINRVPDGCLLVLDEAYVEFAPEGTAPPMQASDPRVIRMRTFSKAYGMAGARVGAAIGHPDLIGNFAKVRDHFGMSRVSQAGALAALQDQSYLQQTLKNVKKSCARISQIARDNRLSPLPTATNFVTIDCGADGDFARAIVAEMIALGIFIRMPFVAPQDRCIRISAGTEADLNLLEKTLPKALLAAKTKKR